MPSGLDARAKLLARFVTLLGDTFPSRVAASLLDASGVSELIARTPREYLELADSLLQEPGHLGDLRRRIAEARVSGTLFDSCHYAARFAEAIDGCVRARWPAVSAAIPDVKF